MLRRFRFTPLVTGALALVMLTVAVSAAWAGRPVFRSATSALTSCLVGTPGCTSTSPTAKVAAAAAGSSSDVWLVKAKSDFEARSVGKNDSFTLAVGSTLLLYGCVNGGNSVPADSLKSQLVDPLAGVLGSVTPDKGGKFAGTITTNGVVIDLNAAVPADIAAALRCGTGQKASLVGVTLGALTLTATGTGGSTSIGLPDAGTFIHPAIKLN